MIRSRNFIATPPGATIKEQLSDRKMNQKEFASRMEMSEKHISRLINGEVQLTPDVAMRLEMVLGLSARFWNNLESIYREKVALATAENEMDEDIVLSKNFPYREMAKNGWVQQTNKTEEKVVNLRKFFEIVKLQLLKEDFIPAIACRRMSVTDKADSALIAWAQKAKIEARNIITEPINISKLSSNIEKIRAMTILPPDEFCPKLINLLSGCGIALVFLPHIEGSFLHGATFYDKNKIVIGLTVRGKDADKFWFSLFHEIAHIIYGHISQAEGTSKEDEEKADEYAKEVLIPNKTFEAYVSNASFSRPSIVNFARSINIDPGIVVGRLQKYGFIDYSYHNGLKKRYEIKIQ